MCQCLFYVVFKIVPRCFNEDKFLFCKMKKYYSIGLCRDICASPSRSNENSMSCHIDPNVEFRVSQTPREYGMLFFLQIIWIGTWKRDIYLKLLSYWIFVPCNETAILQTRNLLFTGHCKFSIKRQSPGGGGWGVGLTKRCLERFY